MQDSKAPTPIPLVMDGREARMIPQNVIPAANYANRHRRPNSPKLVVLTSNMLFKGMTDFLSRFSPDDYKSIIFVSTEEELQAELVR